MLRIWHVIIMLHENFHFRQYMFLLNKKILKNLKIFRRHGFFPSVM
jgi:hypothetical protein